MNTQFIKKPELFGYLSALLAAILFGSVSTLAKPALISIHPFVVAFLVYFLASLVSTPIAQRKKLSLNRKDWGLLIVIALSGAVIAPVLFFVGLEQTTASDTAILGNGEIIFSVLLALIFFKERIGKISSIAVIMVLIGVLIVTTNLEFSSSFDLKNIGNVFVIVATVFWALDNNLSKIISKRIDVARIVQLKSAIGGTILLFLVLVFQVPFDIEIDQIPNILLLGTLGFGMSIFLFLHGLKRIGTVKTVMIFSTSAIFGLVFASGFLDEQISMFQIIAIIIMLSGLYLLHKKSTN